MFKIEESKKIGEYLAKLIDKKYESRRKFCREYIALDGGDREDEESIRKMSNRLSQMLKGIKTIQTYDLPIFTELLKVSCEEILTAGKYVVPNTRRITNYDIAFSRDEKEWEEYIQREDKLILNYDEYGMTVIDYALQCKNYHFLKYLVDKKYIWFIGENDKDFAYSNFGAGTSIKRREIGNTDILSVEMRNRTYLRSQMISLAIDNHDFKMLTELKAREIPSLYMTSYLGVRVPDCQKDYDADMIEHIAESNHEEIITYFADEFEIQTQQDKKYVFVFPYINELLDLLLKQKSKYADKALVKAIDHNKHTYHKLKKLIADAYEGYQKDLFWVNDESNLKKNANETIAKELDYFENGNMINFRQRFTPNLKCSQIEGITTNIIYVSYHSNNDVTQHFIDEINDYYNKIRNLMKNPITEGDLR
ncbi:MAG: hypothetical protein J5993_02140 [Clostridia bacterium]|nr:hypothetical protein [Clostridia bacterium]